MKKEYRQPARGALGRRLTAITAAVAVSGALLSGLLEAFDHASQMPWLANTAENAERLAQCRPTLGATAHAECVERVIEDVLSPPTPDVAILKAGEERAAR